MEYIGISGISLKESGPLRLVCVASVASLQCWLSLLADNSFLYY